jgi:hypothetical protein
MDVHDDDVSADETMRIYPSSGGGYYPAAQPGYAGPQPISPPYPTVPSGPPYAEPGRWDPVPPPAQPATRQPVRHMSVASLFMVTVMVVVIVAGAVSIVYILRGDRGGAPSASAAPPSASGTPSISAAQCLLGDWTLTRWKFTYNDDSEYTTETGGGIHRYHADGTGEWDFGSGVAASGMYEGKPSTARITGRVTFAYTTGDGTISYSNVVSTTGIVIYQSSRVVADAEVEPENSVADKYTCTGDSLRITSDTDETELRRR